MVLILDLRAQRSAACQLMSAVSGDDRENDLQRKTETMFDRAVVTVPCVRHVVVKRSSEQLHKDAAARCPVSGALECTRVHSSGSTVSTRPFANIRTSVRAVQPRLAARSSRIADRALEHILVVQFAMPSSPVSGVKCQVLPGARQALN